MILSRLPGLVLPFLRIYQPGGCLQEGDTHWERQSLEPGKGARVGGGQSLLLGTEKLVDVCSIEEPHI